MRFYFTLTFFLFLQALQAQVVRQPLIIKYAGLGAYSKNFVDVFSTTSNQASLAQLKNGSFGVYGERRFMLADLKTFSGVVAYPTSSGTFGVQGDYFGSSDYNESQLGLMYARKVSSQVDVGVKFNMHSVRIAGYGSASTVNFEAGTILHLTDKLHAGLHVYNPTSSKIGKTANEKLASVYRMGLGYEASDKVFVSAEIIKQEDQRISVNTGCQYNLHSKIFIRAGVATLSNNSYAGVGLKLNFGRLDLNASYHPQLGFTPGVLFILNFTKAEK